MPDRQAEAGQSQQPKHHMHALGQGTRKYGSEEIAPTTARELLPKRMIARKRRTEFYALSAQDKVRIMHASFMPMCSHHSMLSFEMVCTHPLVLIIPTRAGYLLR